MKKKILFNTEFTRLSTGYAVYGYELMKALHNTGKYELFELASYARGNDPQHQQWMRESPWRIFPNMPANAAEQAEYDSNPINEFGQWKFDQVCLEVQPDIVCFPPNSLVMTIDGYVEIQKVKVGDLVLTHNNRFRPVINTHKNEYHGNLVSIYTNTCNEPVKVTPEHPILIYKNKKQTNKKKNRYDIYKDEIPQFISAKDVKIGDLVVLPSFNSTTDISIDVRNYLDNYQSDGKYIKPHIHENDIKIKYDITCDKDFARLCGYIIGDGYIGKRQIKISLGEHETDFIKDVIDLYSKIFGEFIKPTAKKIDDKLMIDVCVNSSLLGEFFTKFLGGQTPNKKIPKEIIQSSKSTREGLISGLIRSDGCYSKNTVNFSTVNKKLAYTYRALCASIGIGTTIKKKVVKEVKAIKLSYYNYISYDVNGYGDNAIKLHEITNKKENSIGTNLDRNKDRSRIKLLDKNHFVASVKRVRKETNYSGQVYNLTIDEDNSYVAQWCVHNCSFTDYWMHNFIDSSPFRKLFKTVIMATADAICQQSEWLDFYQRTDYVLNYTEFGDRVFREEGGGTINLRGVASPAVDSNIFNPVPNKREFKAANGLDPNSIIIGMVARNQKRKKFPALAESFSSFLHQLDLNNTENIFLYLHTAHPDMGFDVPYFVKENGLSHKILFTFCCKNCKHSFPSFYQDVKVICPRCRGMAGFANSQNGVSRETLAGIYNLMDLYVQYAISEGFGIPLVEAAACGVPICATNYSGMESILENLGGHPINVKVLDVEAETNRKMAIPDNESLVEYIKKFTAMPESMRLKMGYQTYLKTAQRYGSWQATAKVWENVFDEIVIQEENQWKTNIDVLNIALLPPCPSPQQMNDYQFVNFCLTEILRRPDLSGSYVHLKMVRDLIYGGTAKGQLGFFSNDSSLIGSRPGWSELTRESLYNYVKGTRDKINKFEIERYNRIQNGMIK